MSNLPNYPFELYVATPCRETIVSWLSRQETSKSMAEISMHFQQPIEDTYNELVASDMVLGFIFRGITLEDYMSGSAPLTPDTLVFVHDRQIPAHE